MTRRRTSTAPRSDNLTSGTTDPRSLTAHRPYRWHGIPGWDPATVAGPFPRGRDCPACPAKAGEGCVTAAHRGR